MDEIFSAGIRADNYSHLYICSALGLSIKHCILFKYNEIKRSQRICSWDTCLHSIYYTLNTYISVPLHLNGEILKLYEYEAKDIFAKYGIPVQRGGLAVSPAEVRKIAEELNRPVVLKAQVPVAGRGKAGGILFADTPEEAEAKAREMFKRSIKGYKIEKILVVKRVDIAREMYLSITIDRFLRKTVIIASRIGGMEIEEIARQYPEMISKYFIDPLIGLKDFHVRGVVASLRLDEKLRKEASLIARKMYQVFIDYDCELVES
ncbi:MAG TPA: hypothetical protein ENF53_03035, partial [Thermoprotei archaeon]|nr:hypothetical protein [Thermoprotei archaeon]